MKMNIWDILAWIAFAIVIAYFILKALHILNSPEIVGIITILSAGYFVGRYAMKSDTDMKGIKTEINHIKTEISGVRIEISCFEKSVRTLESEMIWVKTNLTSIRDKCMHAK